ncbi:MAG: DJ-1/PfpI family protein [Eubacteriales bacterium]|nr:DJ-1/PfpI family protein [Eubacteriales bacterium]
MAKVYSFLADGLEEIEALAPVDMLRRTGNEVVTVSIMGRTLVHGAHQIDIMADQVFEDVDFADADLLILPGGGLGTQNLGAYAPLLELLKKQYEAGRRVAAICAAPMIFGKLGFVQGRKAIIYPGMEAELTGAEVLDQPVITDGNVTTGHGPGAAIDFGLELVSLLNGEETAAVLKKQMVYQH